MIELNNVKPINGHCLIEPKKETTTDAGIFIPETAENKNSSVGKVIAVADDYINPSGNKLPINVKVGDEVIYNSFSGDGVEINGIEYRMIECIYIKAIINN